MNTLAQDTFYHSAEIEELLDKMIKGANSSFTKTETIKEIKAEIGKLKQFVITVQREA